MEMLAYSTNGNAVHASNPDLDGQQDFIVHSVAMQSVIDMIRVVAQNDHSVIVQGPTGSGKEMVAREIHRASRRSHGPVIVVDCAALSPSLIESELFGSERGAFTGAPSGKRPGLFESADGGTVIIDELSDLPIELQGRFLRIIETKTIRRLGGHQEVPLDIRILVLTRENVETLLEKKALREDLYYRLEVFRIDVPPLKDRPEDIIPLVMHFMRQTRKRPKPISDAALHALFAYAWPGNVRELRNAIIRAMETDTGSELSVSDLGVCQNPHPRLTTRQFRRQEVFALFDACKGDYEKLAQALGMKKTSAYNLMYRYRRQENAS